ncbi:MAG: DUF3667 domain-containing protein [Bacteroidales bacterium]|nr:DUF3667 domain-containing protein [Bacteroidales bacterium]
MSKLKFQARKRAFSIWQKLGYLPWSVKKDKSKNGDFYKGAFDSIPFLNNDAKRTFVHLLLRPGYMIRDYIKGQHERYLAPLTSLIIFYAFFAMVSSIVNPEYSKARKVDKTEVKAAADSIKAEVLEEIAPADSLGLDVDVDVMRVRVKKSVRSISAVMDLLDLDRHPEKIDSPTKASLAALEGNLRSQGVYLFLGQFLILWMAMWLALRKRGLGISASAATAAYVLCQFCFFMFFSLFFASNDKGEIGIGLMAVLLTIDYSQLFGIGWKKGFKLAVKTGLTYLVSWVALIALVFGVMAAVLFLTPGGAS